MTAIIVYKICNSEDDLTFIGSTKQKTIQCALNTSIKSFKRKIRNSMTCDTSSLHKHMKLIGHEKFMIIKLATIIIDDQELRKKKVKQYIDKLEQQIGSNNILNVSDQERREKMLKCQKKCYRGQREKRLAYSKKYYAAKKEVPIR